MFYGKAFQLYNRTEISGSPDSYIYIYFYVQMFKGKFFQVISTKPKQS